MDHEQYVRGFNINDVTILLYCIGEALGFAPKEQATLECVSNLIYTIYVLRTINKFVHLSTWCLQVHLGSLWL